MSGDISQAMSQSSALGCCTLASSASSCATRPCKAATTSSSDLRRLPVAIRLSTACEMEAIVRGWWLQRLYSDDEVDGDVDGDGVIAMGLRWYAISLALRS